MTNEEAREAIKFGHCDDIYYRKEYEEAVNMAIKALEQQPCEEYNYKALWEQAKWERDVATEQLEQLGYSLGEKIRTSEDCISRQALIEKATSWDKHFADSERYVSLTDIQNAPSVTPQPKRGKWISIDATHSKCEKCEAIFEITSPNAEANFCPSCGVLLESEDEEVQGADSN